ncbi:MAG TPA: HD domain-containing protein, partial [Chitinophagaceae bacterium]|nr:HD domain-containing protein [Chitinophagaceae bacterium]
TSKEDLVLLKIASLYHDSGFLVTYKGHEEAGCKIVREELPAFEFNASQIDSICEMIMATRIPQTPINHLGEIICDADLDYLGRPDFFTISNSLFLEMKERGWVSNERDWNIKQVAFFKAHYYFTSSSKKLREKEKQKHLEMIEAMI